MILQKMMVSFQNNSNYFIHILIFFIVTLDASGEPVKKERNLETHCGWLCTKLYIINNLLINKFTYNFI
jgi:hypothetical protein